MDVCAESQRLTSVKRSFDDSSRDSVISVRYEEKSKSSGSACKILISFWVKILFSTVDANDFIALQ